MIVATFGLVRGPRAMRVLRLPPLARLVRHRLPSRTVCLAQGATGKWFAGRYVASNRGLFVVVDCRFCQMIIDWAAAAQAEDKDALFEVIVSDGLGHIYSFSLAVLVRCHCISISLASQQTDG